MKGAVAFVILASVTLLAQPSPSFDVASIKQNKSGDDALRLDILPGGRFAATSIPLRQFIRAAYTLELFQIVDVPAWVDSERFDITATTDKDITVNVPWSPGGKFAGVQLMMQSLLAERFKMIARNEVRESPIYVLVIDRAEHKLKPAAPECGSQCGVRGVPGSFQGRKIPLSTFAGILSQVTGRLVVDATGLTESYDINLRWQSDATPSGDGPSIFTAVQEQLGLRLEPRRGPVPVLAISSIDRPTEN